MVLCVAGTIMAPHEWQQTIKLLEDLAAAPVAGGTTAAAAARASNLDSVFDKLLKRQTSAVTSLAPMTQAAWNKLMNKQVCFHDHEGNMHCISVPETACSD
jgi:DNA-binding transcriptional MocR family regulator